MGEPERCSETFDDVKALDGKRVEIVGVYTTTLVRKGSKSKEDDAHAKTVAVVEDNRLTIMIEVYWSPAGTRSDEEIARFSRKRVGVVGTLRAQTPTQTEEGAPMETMIGPCVTEIERIEEAP